MINKIKAERFHLMNLSNYKVLYKKRAEKFLFTNKLEGIKFYKAFSELTSQKENLRKYDIKKYHCKNNNTYRLRIGDYRAIFEVCENEIIVLVLDIGSRGDIYK